MKKIPPAWFLFFFAPLTAEYVSGSSPYLNPFVLLANLLLYGPGALLIRELKARWRKGWLAVFILAVASVVAEEGLMLNTLFDPTKNTVGRLLGGQLGVVFRHVGGPFAGQHFCADSFGGSYL